MKRNNKLEYILEIPVSNLTQEACLEKIMTWIHEGRVGKTIVCANPYSLEVARRDRVFRESLMVANLVIPDGIGIVLASRILGGRIRERVTGSDIFLGLNQVLDKEGGQSVFFLGSTEETLNAIRLRFVVNFPNLRIAGSFSPPFRAEFSEDENRAMVDAVNKVRPDILWVGMTAPKQEKWLLRNRGRLMVRVSLAVGAVFDFYAGKVQRPSSVYQHFGLEWVIRLFREPRRLFRRVPLGLGFMGRILVERLTSKYLKLK